MREYWIFVVNVKFVFSLFCIRVTEIEQLHENFERFANDVHLS